MSCYRNSSYLKFISKTYHNLTYRKLIDIETLLYYAHLNLRYILWLKFIEVKIWKITDRITTEFNLPSVYFHHYPNCFGSIYLKFTALSSVTEMWHPPLQMRKKNMCVPLLAKVKSTQIISFKIKLF